MSYAYKYYFANRRAKVDSTGKECVIVNKVLVGNNECCLVRFDDYPTSPDLVIDIKNLSLIRTPICICGNALNKTMNTCLKCRWIKCPKCGNCGCSITQ